MNDPDLPPEFEPLLAALDAQPEHVREMWRYALVLMLIDDEKARVVETHDDGDRLRFIVQTTAGDRFEIVRPQMSDETEMILLEQIRAIVNEDDSEID